MTDICLQAVGVQLGLLLPELRALAGAFGLHERQRHSVVAPQHVVDVAVPSVLGMPLTANSLSSRSVERPAGLGEQEVDEAVAGFGLVVIVIVDLLVSGLGVFDRFPATQLRRVLRLVEFVFSAQKLGVGSSCVSTVPRAGRLSAGSGCGRAATPNRKPSIGPLALSRIADAAQSTREGVRSLRRRSPGLIVFSSCTARLPSLVYFRLRSPPDADSNSARER